MSSSPDPAVGSPVPDPRWVGPSDPFDPRWVHPLGLGDVPVLVGEDLVWPDDLLCGEELVAAGVGVEPTEAQQGELDELRRAAGEPAPVPPALEVEVALGRGASGLGLADLLVSRPDAGQRCEDEIVDHIEGWGRVIAFCQARQAAEAGELLARREAVPADPKRPFAKDAWRDATSQVALALRTSTWGAEQVVADSQVLAEWAATAAALAAGRIDLPTVRAITDEGGLVDPEHQAVLEAAALAQAADGRTARQVRLFTRRAAMKLDPGAAARRAEAARGDRGVAKTQVVDDMGDLRATLTAAELKAVWDTLTTRATALAGTDPDGNPVSLDDRRADVLVDMITHPERVRECEHTDQSRWRADLVVQASTVAGGDDDPGELPGYGLVTAEAARAIAAGATWRRLDVAPDGQVIGRASERHHPPTGAARLDHQRYEHQLLAGAPLDGAPLDGQLPDGQLPDTQAAVLAGRVAALLAGAAAEAAQHRSTPRYRPTTAIGDHVEAVHRRCRFPGCRRPSARCDLDHGIAYSAGGPTCTCSLIPLCRRHHLVKHTDGWSIQVHPDRSVTWTTPTGHRYRAPPPTLWD